ncbi:MAG: VOC family protein [bacterium]|nr:VOC family protein [bacterium]
MLRGLHRTVVSTPDLDRALHFYRDLIGLKVITKGSWGAGWESADALLGRPGTAARWVMLSAGNSNLELVQYGTPETAPQQDGRPVRGHGISRVCFEVIDLHVMYRRLRDEGVQFDSEPQPQGDLGTSVYARDPDGNVVELVEYPDRYHEEALEL